MSEKAIAALDKLVPAPSTKNYQFYRGHYELIHDEINRLQSEVERLRGRVTWFEEWRDRFIDACDANPRAWLLIKQAEAVEAFGSEMGSTASRCGRLLILWANDYAQRLRQQAAEIEK